jgi:hypothetical protein
MSSELRNNLVRRLAPISARFRGEFRQSLVSIHVIGAGSCEHIMNKCVPFSLLLWRLLLLWQEDTDNIEQSLERPRICDMISTRVSLRDFGTNLAQHEVASPGVDYHERQRELNAKDSDTYDPKMSCLRNNDLFSGWRWTVSDKRE